MPVFPFRGAAKEVSWDRLPACHFPFNDRLEAYPTIRPYLPLALVRLSFPYLAGSFKDCDCVT
jgi:hypothetical protein